MSTARHESEDRLELYALGRLGESETAEIEEHLLFCEVCRTKLDDVAEFAQPMREELRRETPPQRSAAAGWFRWLTPQVAMAGAFAIVLLAVGLYKMNSGTPVAPLATLQLVALRGEMQSVGLAREIDLTVRDAPERGGPFRMEIVNSRGATVWAGVPVSAAEGLSAKIHKRLRPGDYFGRLYGANKELVHEYGFRVRG